MGNTEYPFDAQTARHLDDKINSMISDKLSSIQNIKIENHFYLSDNSSIYQNSTPVIQPELVNYLELLDALSTIKSEIESLNLAQQDILNLNKALEDIKIELIKYGPEKANIKTCFELIPLSVNTVQSIIQLGKILGIS